MRIHLADSSGERGHFALLSSEIYPSHLVSFAYRKAALPSYENSWVELGKINLACPPDCRDRLDALPRVIIDSGAFTAWTSGKPIHVHDYAKWALDLDVRWRSKTASLEFMNLDVIGDQEGTWRNQAILEGLGMKPMVIVTYGVDLKHLDRALEQYDYIALGGLVPYTRHKDKLKKWLDACFGRIMAYRKKTGILRRIHLLGVTTEWVLKRYPCYSSDSSSWVSCLRFGDGGDTGIKKIPRYTESEGSMAANLHALRCAIRRFKRMEKEITALWIYRGVT